MKAHSVLECALSEKSLVRSHKFNSPVLLLVCRGVIGCYRIVWSEALARHPPAGNAVIDQPLFNGIRTVLRKLHVHSTLTGVVRISANFNGKIGMLLKGGKRFLKRCL